MMNQLFTS